MPWCRGMSQGSVDVQDQDDHRATVRPQRLGLRHLPDRQAPGQDPDRIRQTPARRADVPPDPRRPLQEGPERRRDPFPGDADRHRLGRSATITMGWRRPSGKSLRRLHDNAAMCTSCETHSITCHAKHTTTTRRSCAGCDSNATPTRRGRTWLSGRQAKDPEPANRSEEHIKETWTFHAYSGNTTKGTPHLNPQTFFSMESQNRGHPGE